jgi:hypothetical protein
LEGQLSLESVLKSVHGSKRISKTPLELPSVVAEKPSNAVVKAHKTKLPFCHLLSSFLSGSQKKINMELLLQN